MAKLLGIGNATLDIIHHVDGYPEENSEVRCRERHVRRGGNAANTLVVLSQLGVACSWADVLVDNEEGLCRIVAPHESGGAVIVTSERLSDDPGWEVVPRNHAVLIGNGAVELRTLV